MTSSLRKMRSNTCDQGKRLDLAGLWHGCVMSRCCALGEPGYVLAGTGCTRPERRLGLLSSRLVGGGLPQLVTYLLA